MATPTKAPPTIAKTQLGSAVEMVCPTGIPTSTPPAKPKIVDNVF